MSGAAIYGEGVTLSDSFGNERGYFDFYEVFGGIEEFLNNNYRGLVEVNTELTDNAVIFVSLESLVSLLGEVIELVRGRALIRIRIYGESKRIVMQFSTDPPLECEHRVNARFAKMALNAGFEIERRGAQVLLSIGCFDEKQCKVYAPIVKDTRKKIVAFLKQKFSNNPS